MNNKLFTVSKLENIDEENLRIRHYISTPTQDRYGDVVNPMGMVSEKFRSNPVVLFGHNNREFPIGKNLELTPSKNGVMALTQFDRKSELASEIFRLNKEGFLNSWSIGFIPIKEYYKDSTDADGKKIGSYNYIEEWELLEYSSVPIPANPDAVNLMLKDIKNNELKDIFKYFELENRFKKLEEKLEKILKEPNKEIEEIKKQLTDSKLENVGTFNLEKLMITLKEKIIKAIQDGQAGAFRNVTGRDL